MRFSNWDQIESKLDVRSIDENRMYLDLGIVTITPKARVSPGYTAKHKLCCLNEFKEQLQMGHLQASKLKVVDYLWCFLRDVGGMTIVGPVKSISRLGGLVYTQMYSQDKLSFDAQKHFPLGADDDTLIAMSLGEQYREAICAILGIERFDMNACRLSFNHSGLRIMQSIRNQGWRDFAAREEFRITLKLYKALNQELRDRGSPPLRTFPHDNLFFFETQLTHQFVEFNTLPLARWYQEVVRWADSKAPTSQIGTDRQKLAVLISLLLKHSYSTGFLAKFPVMWQKITRNEDDSTLELGLGLKAIIKEFGYAWLPHEIFNFSINSFADGVADRFPFPISTIQQNYRRRGGARKTSMELMQEVDQVCGRLPLGTNKSDEDKAFVMLTWLAMRIIKEYMRNVWTSLFQSNYEFAGKQAEREKQMANPRKRPRTTARQESYVFISFDIPPNLLYTSVRRKLGEKLKVCGLGSRGKKGHQTKDAIFNLLFVEYIDSLDQPQDQRSSFKSGWKDKSYLHALMQAQHALDAAKYKQLLVHIRRLFRYYCRCVPNVSRDRWLAPCSQDKTKNSWMGFDTLYGLRMRRPLNPHEPWSSWQDELGADIHRHVLWNVPCDQITGTDSLKTLMINYPRLKRWIEGVVAE